MVSYIGVSWKLLSILKVCSAGISDFLFYDWQVTQVAINKYNAEGT